MDADENAILEIMDADVFWELPVDVFWELPADGDDANPFKREGSGGEGNGNVRKDKVETGGETIVGVTQMERWERNVKGDNKNNRRVERPFRWEEGAWF